jgi:hypothetical protein
MPRTPVSALPEIRTMEDGMLSKIMVICGLLSLAACSSIDNSTYKRGSPGVTDAMVDEQAADDARQTNAVLAFLSVLALGAFLNAHNGGVAPTTPQDPPPPPP